MNVTVFLATLRMERKCDPMILSGNRWLISRARRPRAQLRLLTIPSAGSGSGLFHSWDSGLPQWVEHWSVMAPGRESRYSEAIPPRLLDYVEAVGSALEELDQVPLVVFGHSMGGRIGFELAHFLRAAGRPAPLHLFVSSIPAPSRYGREAPEHSLEDESLLRAVRRRYGGFPPEVERYPDLLRTALRVLRADLHALETHWARPGPPLAIPISAFGGRDDPSVSEEDLGAWSEETAGGFDLILFPGDHRYLEAGSEAVLASLVRKLKASGRPAGPSAGTPRP